MVGVVQTDCILSFLPVSGGLRVAGPKAAALRQAAV